MDRSLMANATSSDDSPTSGFQLNEISNLTKSNYQANVQIQEYLVSRIKKDNYNIKYKCLVIIKHICRTGRPEFKREMAKYVDVIKDCLQYKGSPDPLRGDEIYRRVREYAKEVLEALFDGTMPVSTSAVAAANRIQGHGNDYVSPNNNNNSTLDSATSYLSSIVSNIQVSVLGDGTDTKYEGHPGAVGGFSTASTNNNSFNSNSYTNNNGGGNGGGNHSNTSSYNNNNSSSYSSSNNSGGGMQGMGNPNFKDPRQEKTWIDSITSTFSTSSSSSGITSDLVQQDNNNYGSGIDTQRNNNNNNNNNNNTYNSTSSGYQFATNRGINAIHANASAYSQPTPPYQHSTDTNNSNNSNNNIYHNNIITNNSSSNNTSGNYPVGRVGGALSSGEYEQGVINSLCEPSGLRPIPSEDELQRFLNISPTLSADMVGDCLIAMLNSDAWQSRVKALIVITRLTSTSGCELHRDWWLLSQHLEDLNALTSDAKGNVRIQATKTIRSLTTVSGGSEISSLDSSNVSNKAQQQQQQSSSSNKSSTGGVVDGLKNQQIDNQSISLLEIDDIDNNTSIPSNRNSFITSSSLTVNTNYNNNHSSFLVSMDNCELFEGMSLNGTSTTPIHSTPLSNVQTAAANTQFPLSMTITDSTVATTTTNVTSTMMSVQSSHMAEFDFLNDTSADDQLIIPPLTCNQMGITSSLAVAVGSNKDDFLGLMGTATSIPHNGLTYSIQPPQQSQMTASVPPRLSPLSLSQGSVTSLGGGGGGNNYLQQPPPPPQYSHQTSYQNHPQQQQQRPYSHYAVPPHLTRYPNPVPPKQQQRTAIYSPQSYQQQQQQQQLMPGNIILRPGASVIAPGMLSHAAERKHIPNANDNEDMNTTTSGFGFVVPTAANQSKKSSSSSSDSFSFVTDAMKAQK